MLQWVIPWGLPRSFPPSPVSPQLKVLPRDLQLCSETASGVDVGGQHEWGELVQLDPRTVGVIVRLERETFQVCLTLRSYPKSMSLEVVEQRSGQAHKVH